VIKLGAVVALAALAVTSCGSSDTPRPDAVAVDFARAVAEDDGATACALLAPKTREEVEQSTSHPCAEGILEEDVPESTAARGTDAYGRQARVVLDKDVVFLARFSLGWRVVAAACEDQGQDRPYDCDVSGG
jgi:hypothetical protein